MTALAMIVSAVSAPAAWTGRDGRRRLVLTAAAAVACGAVLLPFLLPYYRASTEQGLVRSFEEVAYYSGQWRDYLATGGRLHHALWSWRWFDQQYAALPGPDGPGLERRRADGGRHLARPSHAGDDRAGRRRGDSLLRRVGPRLPLALRSRGHPAGHPRRGPPGLAGAARARRPRRRRTGQTGAPVAGAGHRAHALQPPPWSPSKRRAPRSVTPASTGSRRSTVMSRRCPRR